MSNVAPLQNVPSIIHQSILQSNAGLENLVNCHQISSGSRSDGEELTHRPHPDTPIPSPPESTNFKSMQDISVQAFKTEVLETETSY